MNGRYRRVAATLAFGAVAGIAACGGDADEAQTPTVSGEVKIGLLADLAGNDAETAQDAQRGATLAVTLINADDEDARYPTNGLWGTAGQARLVLVTADTKGDEQLAADETVRLVSEEGVVALVGAADSESTLEASQRAERLQTPFVSGDDPLDALTERGLNWYFRPGPDARSYSSALISLLRNAEPAGVERRRIALLYGNDSAGNDLEATVSEFIDETGFSLVARVRYDPAQPALVDHVEEIAAAQPDIVLFSASHGIGEQLAGALLEAEYVPPGVVVYGRTAEASALASRPELDGRVSRQAAWSATVASADPHAAAVAERYEAEFGAPMTEVAASAFTAVSVLARAIDDAASSDPERIRSALVALDLPGNFTIMPWTGVRFDGTHQNVLSGTVIEQATGDSFVVVYPRDLASVPFNWPNTE